ncbi:MAG: hypothetical protein ACFFBD_04240, partial [Candidatus Hodarchaeota archaeon]
GHFSMGAGDRLSFKDPRVLYEGIGTKDTHLRISIVVKEADRLTLDDTIIKHSEPYVIGTYSSNNKLNVDLENKNARVRVKIWDSPSKY